MTPTAELHLSDAAGAEAWYRRAGVRQGPRRLTEADEVEHSKLFFPVTLVPHLGHEAVMALCPAEQRYLNAQHLYQWLDFTTHFEVAVINRATLRIAEGTAGLDLPVESRMVAFQIYVDEGYHSLYNLDVRQQLERESGIPALPYDFAPFLTQLDRVVDDVPDLRRLVQLLQVVVFETLITSMLVDIPNDPTVKTLVRDTVRDHAIDEGRHHAYFATLFQELWRQLPASIRTRVAPFLPELIVRSLAPNHDSARRALLAVGLTPALAAEIVADCYSPAATIDYIRTASSKTVALFRRCGVLDVPRAADRFHDLGLLSSTTSPPIDVGGEGQS
jgi:P-aminobenzoate N-oxygenase AurF